jgi:hypothetical protein
MVKAFLAHKKQKTIGNTFSQVQLRKNHDAILWGSQQAKQLLLRAYYDDTEKFLTSYWKETVKMDTKASRVEYFVQVKRRAVSTLFCHFSWEG